MLTDPAARLRAAAAPGPAGGLAALLQAARGSAGALAALLRAATDAAKAERRRPLIVLIACSASKVKTHGKRIPAAELYSASVLFEKSLAYARAVTREDHIRILSAKHGVIPTTEKIATYNRSMRALSPAARKDWGERVRKQLLRDFGHEAADVIILAGKDYTEPLHWLDSEVRRNAGLTLTMPFGEKRGERMNIGQRLHWLDEQARARGEVPNPTREAAARAQLREEFSYLGSVGGYMVWPDVGTRVRWSEDTRERRGKVIRHGTQEFEGRITRLTVDEMNPRDIDVWGKPDGNGAERRLGIGGIRVPATDLPAFVARAEEWDRKRMVAKYGAGPPQPRPAPPVSQVEKQQIAQFLIRRASTFASLWPPDRVVSVETKIADALRKEGVAIERTPDVPGQTAHDARVAATVHLRNVAAEAEGRVSEELFVAANAIDRGLHVEGGHAEERPETAPVVGKAPIWRTDVMRSVDVDVFARHGDIVVHQNLERQEAAGFPFQVSHVPSGVAVRAFSTLHDADVFAWDLNTPEVRALFDELVAATLAAQRLGRIPRATKDLRKRYDNLLRARAPLREAEYARAEGRAVAPTPTRALLDAIYPALGKDSFAVAEAMRSADEHWLEDLVLTKRVRSAITRALLGDEERAEEALRVVKRYWSALPAPPPRRIIPPVRVTDAARRGAARVSGISKAEARAYHFAIQAEELAYLDPEALERGRLAFRFGAGGPVCASCGCDVLTGRLNGETDAELERRMGGARASIVSRQLACVGCGRVYDVVECGPIEADEAERLGVSHAPVSVSG